MLFKYIKNHLLAIIYIYKGGIPLQVFVAGNILTLKRFSILS